MRHVKSNVNILKPLQNKIQNNNIINLKPSQSNNNLKNPKNYLKLSEQETNSINSKNNFLINLGEKTCKSSFSSLVINNNNINKNTKNSLSPNKILSFNKKNKTSTNTIFNTNHNNFIENNNNSANRGISIRLNFKNKIINNNFSKRNRARNNKKRPVPNNTPKNVNINSGFKSDFNLNEKIKEKDKQITLLQKDLLQSQKLLNQLQEEKQKEITSTYNSIKRVDSFINNNNNNNSYYNNSINTNNNRMKKYSSLSNFFVSKTDKNTNILRTFYGKGSLITNKSNSKRNTYINNKSTTRIKNVNKSKPKKKNNLNIFTNPSTFVKFQIFKNNIENKNHICKTRNNIHKNYHFGNFNSGSNSNIKKNKNKNFLRAMSYSPNKILTQFLYQYESNCKTGKNTFRKNINIKSTSPSSAQNRINNKRMKNMIKNNQRSKDLDYIINKGENLKKRMKTLLNNYITLSYEIKKNNIKTEIK